MLTMDIPSWTTTLPAASTAPPVHSSRVNIFLPCMSGSHHSIRSSPYICLLQGLGPSSATLQTFMLPSQLPIEMHLPLDSKVFSPWFLCWPWYDFVKHYSPPNPTSCGYLPLLSLITLLPHGGGLFGLTLHYQLLFPHHWVRTQSYTYLQLKVSDLVSQRVVVFVFFSQPRASQPVLIACVQQEPAQEPPQRSNQNHRIIES